MSKIKKIEDFVWVMRGDNWVKKYPASWKGYKKPYTKGKSTSAKIQELTFNSGGYVHPESTTKGDK
jgi:hypothetical protein